MKRAHASFAAASFTLVLLGVVACGSSSSDGFGSPDAAATTQTDASTSNGDTGALASDDGGGSLGNVVDADAADANCNQLRIGILGLPGANASSNFQAWLVSAGTSVTNIQTTVSDPLTAAELAPFDVVVLNWLQRDYTAGEAAIFATWVQAGHGAMSMTGFDNVQADDFHANSLLAPLGMAYVEPLLNGPVTQFATHPITAGLTSVTFAGGYEVSDLGGSASSRTPIAFLPGGDGGTVNVGYAVQMGAGRAFVWGDEWIQFDSEWSTIPQIKQLWVQVFGWIAPSNNCAITPPK